MKIKTLVAATALLSATTFANAAFIGASGEATLESIVNDTIIVSGPSVNLSGDTATNDATTNAYFRASPDAGTSSATFLIEITGGMTTQSFGIYNGSNYVELFSGSTEAVFETDGGYTGPVVDSNRRARVSFEIDGGMFEVILSDVGTGVFFDSDQFGFYLGDASGPRIYSDATMNDGVERFVAVQGKDQRINLGSRHSAGCDEDNIGNCRLWESDDWIVAFEDGSDFDFNDLVVYVEDIVPVPEPGTLALLGLGLLGLGAARRRKA